MIPSRLEGHLCAQVCTAEFMNIYIPDMNMVIKKQTLIWLAEFQRKYAVLSQDSPMT